MALYVYRAYENKFCGLYDIYAIKVIEADNFKDAEAYANEAAYDLIKNTQKVYDSLYSEAQDIYEHLYNIPLEDENDRNFANILQKLIKEDVCSEVYKIDLDTIWNKSIEELNQIAQEDLESFVDDYTSTFY
jgi:hypothetical protein